MWKTCVPLVRSGLLFTALLPACGAPGSDPAQSTSAAGSSAGGAATAGGAGGGASGGTTTTSAGGSTSGGVSTAGSGGTSSAAGAAGAAPGGAGGSAPIPPITGTPGVWENVSPAGHPELFDPNDPSCAGCNFGVRGVNEDPAHPGTFFAPFCYHGLWKSTDWGITWAEVSEDGGPMDNGCGDSSIAPDGSYMVANLLYPHNGYANAAWVSTDGGVTFTEHDLPIGDPCLFEISWQDKTRVVAANHQHEINDLFESTDSGQTWIDQGSIFQEKTLGSPQIHWVDEDTLLAVDDGVTDDGGGTYRGVRSGSTWPWTWTWSKVSNQQHSHATHQLFNDYENNLIFNGGAFGIERSTDRGLTWDTVSTNYSGSVVGTATTLYSTSNGASLGEVWPWLMQADRATGTDWALWASDPPGEPEGMTNGWTHAATGFDGTHSVVLGGHWVAGLWRYVEP